MKSHALDRRQVSLATFKTFALIGLLGPTQLRAGQTITPPNGPCVLTRRLKRGLRDDKAIVVTRAWRMEFARQARGYVVSGEQISVSVEAPERLAAIAQIEEQRSSQGLFPLLLGPDGAIMTESENATQASFDAAVKAAQALLGQSDKRDTAPSPLGQYLAQLQRVGASYLDVWPRDLLYPSVKPFSQVRQIALPDGESGEFEVTWEASAHENSGLLKQARRRVSTRIGADTRQSSEDWTLQMA